LIEFEIILGRIEFEIEEHDTHLNMGAEDCKCNSASLLDISAVNVHNDSLAKSMTSSPALDNDA
jgi:hypothetical protein